MTDNNVFTSELCSSDEVKEFKDTLLIPSSIQYILSTLSIPSNPYISFKGSGMIEELQKTKVYDYDTYFIDRLFYDNYSDSYTYKEENIYQYVLVPNGKKRIINIMESMFRFN